MGKKKVFIDKKNAVTYNLIYRSTEDADVMPERVLVETDKGVGIGKPDIEAASQQHTAHAAAGRRYPPGHPLAWLAEDGTPGARELSDERRRELIQLGFPDDGYDYLRHMRTLGRGAAGLEGVGPAGAAAGPAEVAEDTFAGPSVFVPASEVAPPEEDVRLFDATRLTLMQQVEREEEAAGMMGGVTAFSRQKKAARGADQRELAEIEELMRQMENDDGGDEEGEGDLLDDFVVTATEVDGTCQQQASGLHGSDARGAESDAESSESKGSGFHATSDDGSYEDLTSGSSQGALISAANRGGSSSRGPGRPGSIASTYWREERQDRKELLAVIDERFEHLALEYDEDEIGEMDEQEEGIQGPATLQDFSGVLDEFHATHSQSQRAYEDNVPYHAPGYRSAINQELEQHGFTDEDGGVAIAKAHEALRRAEEAERSGEGGDERVTVWVEEGGPAGAAARERWDCESVLSLRSNLDNHPGRIREPGRRGMAGSGTAAKTVAQGMIKLGRHGIPMGVLPGKPTAAALRQLESTAEARAEMVAAPPAAAQKREKGESSEEKKARKAAVKEAKREARANKKALKEMFKEESTNAQRRVATAQVQAALKLP